MERKRPTKTSTSRPPPKPKGDLVEKRRELLETYFENGRQIASELVAELDLIRRKCGELENENARLRMQLRSDAAIRDLLAKIESLESERSELLSRTTEVERLAQTELERAAAVEEELSNLASLYVSSSQLHSSLDPRDVVATVGQLLLQFLGAGAYVVFSAEGGALVPVASEGLVLDDIGPQTVGSGTVGGAFDDGAPFVLREDNQRPMAIVPLRIGEQPVGAVAVYELLEQKGTLGAFDIELLRMLSTQAATALAGARLAAAAHGAIPRWATEARK
jgi:hypothetical protein